jgi:2-alkenal reductase
MLHRPRHPAFVVVILALVLASLACQTLSPTSAPNVLTPIPDAPGTAVTVPTGPTQPPPAVLPTITPAAPPDQPPASSQEQVLADLYARVNPSVVAIVATAGALEGSQGSGFVFDADGHIVTNFHVVEGAEDIEVDFASGQKFRGTAIGTDADADLAVIRIEAPAEVLVPLPLADSNLVRVGQQVVAIGNPFGLAGTMTVGFISGLGRSLESLRTVPELGGTFSAPDIIQTDAAINPGNSGGPLINLQGEVIGINKAIETESGVNSGVGYAIASNTVRQIVPYLITDGRFVYPYLGITALEELSLDAQEALGLPQATGAYVSSVTPGGPSEQAGLRGDSGFEAGQPAGDGDLIIAIDGQPVVVFSDLMSYLVNNTRPGQEVTLTLLREGQQIDVPVTLGQRP